VHPSGFVAQELGRQTRETAALDNDPVGVEER
jgi:hypothetical protein